MTIKKYQQLLKISFLFITLSAAVDTYAAAAGAEDAQWDRFLTAVKQRVTPPKFSGGAVKKLIEADQWKETRQLRISRAAQVGQDAYKEEGNLDNAIAISLLSLATQEEGCLGGVFRIFFPLPSETDLAAYVKNKVDSTAFLSARIVNFFRSFTLVKETTEETFEGLLTQVINDLTE